MYMSNDNLHRPVLIVIAGPNGSGKTSITSRILRHEWMEDAVYINPDIIAQEKFGDWNSYDAVMQSVKYCEALREECLLQCTCYKNYSRYYKSLANGRILSQVVDRAYFYDNSVDDRDACLLFRLADGHLIKRYVNEIPQWAKDIYSSIL